MEDRITPGLWLETSQATAAEYGRGASLTPGMRRATWWTNLCPGRTDMPRDLPEFRTLGLYELDGGFSAPPERPGWHFRQYPRPGQGSVTGKPTVGLSLVLISPRSPEGAQALRDWADFVHIRHIAEAAVPGMAMITPYERVGGIEGPRFLHLYEITDPDAEAVFKAMPGRVQARLGPPGTPAFNEWAWHPALWINYVNSFGLAGSLDA